MSQNYAQPGPVQPKKSSGSKTLLIVLGVGLGLGLVCCGGLSALTYFGFQKAMSAVADVILEQIKDDPIIVEHLGEITESSMDISATGEASDDGSVLVFNVKGTKSEGVLHVSPNQHEGNNVTLHMPSGETFEFRVELQQSNEF